MSLYAGEEFRIKCIPKNKDTVPPTVLDMTNVNGITATVYKVGVVVITGAMSYSATDKFWFYIWDTTTYTAGMYKIKITISLLDGRTTWEFANAKLL